MLFLTVVLFLAGIAWAYSSVVASIGHDLLGTVAEHTPLRLEGPVGHPRLHGELRDRYVSVEAEHGTAFVTLQLATTERFDLRPEKARQPTYGDPFDRAFRLTGSPRARFALDDALRARLIDLAAARPTLFDRRLTLRAKAVSAADVLALLERASDLADAVDLALHLGPGPVLQSDPDPLVRARALSELHLVDPAGIRTVCEDLVGTDPTALRERLSGPADVAVASALLLADHGSLTHLAPLARAAARLTLEGLGRPFHDARFAIERRGIPEGAAGTLSEVEPVHGALTGPLRHAGSVEVVAPTSSDHEG